MAVETFLGAVAALAERGLPVADLIGLTGQLASAGRADLALQLYRLWLGFNPENPVRYAVNYNFGVLAGNIGDLETAKMAYGRAIEAKPDFVQAYINLGGILERQGATDEAVSQWQAAVDQLAPVNGASVKLKALALRQLGRPQGAHSRAAAEDALRQILELEGKEGDVAEHYIALRLLSCKWPVMQLPEGVSRETLLRSMHPLSAAVFTDHPLFHLAVNHNYNCTRVGFKAEVLDLPPATREEISPRRLKIGYLSSDLCAHAVGYLIVEAMELHDHERLEVFAYYNGPGNSDWINSRIRVVTDHWIDINHLDDEAAAKRIKDDGIDILVDLNGNTKGSRTGVCARRPAPVIVNWLGFPGTMASPYHHYIIADDWIVPPDHEIYYSEKVARLPCYQPNDRKRQLSPEVPTRADAGLPEAAMVYCCFNWTQKISAKVFSLWMEILRQVPESVLWLLDTDAETNRHLTGLAAEQGVSSDRLIFGKWMTSPSHLARYPLADLFLDTYPYGAHTTASDALWRGVPILTLSGRSFASRVCGSLARAAGVPDLVVDTPQEYVRLAVELAADRKRLQSYRKRLAASRDKCVLFDTNLLVKRLEELYAEMWESYRQGRLPQPDLANLDIYLDLAVEDDLDALDMSPISDYGHWFREKLAARHKACPIVEDSRLWTPPFISAG